MNPRDPRQFSRAILICTLCLTLAGCAASYATPGRAADMRALGLSREKQSDAFISRVLEKKPLATLPQSVTRPPREVLETVMEELR